MVRKTKGSKRNADTDSSPESTMKQRRPAKRVAVSKMGNFNDDSNSNESREFDELNETTRPFGDKNAPQITPMPSRTNPIVVLSRDSVLGQKNRRSFAFNGSFAETPVAPSTEDKMEKRKRMHNRIIEQQKSDHRSPNRNGTPDGRKSGLNQLTMEQLKEQYSMCLKLSATNKICTKNAFELNFIDYMSEMLRQNEGPVNFKHVTGALDAGAKIYCNRVDFVHTAANKVASGLAMAADKNEPSARNGDSENEDENANNDPDVCTKPKRKKAARKNVKTLASNPESLNAKPDSQVEIDPVFHQISTSFDMSSANGLLMANLKVDSNFELLLDSNTACHDINSSRLPQSLQQVSIESIYTQLNDAASTTVQICPKLANFEFSNRNENFDLIPSEESRKDNTSQSNLEFDLNAEIEDEYVEDPREVVTPFDDYCDDNVNDEPDFVEKSTRSILNPVNFDSFKNLMSLLSEKPSEYSYFNRQLIGTWAGPNHWRPNHWLKMKAKEIQGIKTKRVRKEFEEQDHIKQGLNEKADQVGGQLQKLKIQTVTKWLATANLSLPDDLCYDPVSLARPFIKCETKFHYNDEPTEADNKNACNNDNGSIDMAMHHDDDSDDDLEGNDDYPQSSDAFGTELLRGASLPSNGLGLSGCINPGGDSMPFIGDNLIDQPHLIQQIQLPYAKYAKKIDVKKLKKAMWNCLTSNLNDTFNPSTPAKRVGKQMDFSNLYKDILKKLPVDMVKNLSSPIGFVALLHLSNEKNLVLSGKSDMSDFTIDGEI